MAGANLMMGQPTPAFNPGTTAIAEPAILSVASLVIELTTA
jgi:hypothetical protein